MDFLSGIIAYVINPGILLLFSVASIVFIYGVVVYWIKGSGPNDRATGGRHILWGLVGMLIMIGTFAIMSFVQNTLGIDPEDRPTTIPSGL
jgi:uncharacterized RDD family membrane protein YckC